MPERVAVVAGLAAGGPQSRGRRFRVQAMLQDVVDWHGPGARARGVHIRFDRLACPSHWVRADETRIREICDDLVWQGLELTIQGTLALSAQLEACGGDLVLLQVRVCGASPASRVAASALRAARMASAAMGAGLDIEHAADGRFSFTLRLTVRSACEPPHDSVILCAAMPTVAAGAAVRTLPRELRASLRHAALRADRRALRLLVAQLDTLDPDAARLVRDWVDLFQYEPLLAWCSSQRAVRARAHPPESV